jgi:hypothetical protein
VMSYVKVSCSLEDVSGLVLLQGRQTRHLSLIYQERNELEIT